jgi:hypothetical protein
MRFCSTLRPEASNDATALIHPLSHSDVDSQSNPSVGRRTLINARRSDCEG